MKGKGTLTTRWVLSILLTMAFQSALATEGSAANLTITTYSTGNEGHLITFPDGSTLAIDCADGTMTEKSHFHSDHCASCSNVGQYNRNNVTPGQYLYNSDGVTVQVVIANTRVIGESATYVSCPASDENKESVGLWIKYGGFDYLTAGDLTSSPEGSLGNELASRGINIDVLKVSHHGSNTSSKLTYLQDILPEYAVICGNASAPTDATLSNLTTAGVKTIYYAYNYSLGAGYPVFRANGPITITTDGSTYTFTGNGFSHGPYQVDDYVPPPDPTPTPTPFVQTVFVTATPSSVAAGEQFKVNVAIDPLANRPFDAYAVVFGPAGVFSIKFGNVLVPGVSPIAQNVFSLPEGYNATLLDMIIPPGVSGDYQAVVGLADAGKKVTSVMDTFAWNVAFFQVK